MKHLLRLLALAASFAQVAHALENSETLRVVSWNLQWFPGGRIGASKEVQDQHIEQVREEIRKLNADVLLLQEVGSEGALEETLKPLGPEWKIAIISRFKDGNFISGQQVAIAARMPADAVWSETWAEGWAGPPRGYAQASFMIGGKRVNFYSLHLKSNLGDAVSNTSKREDATEQLLSHKHTGQDRGLIADAVVIGGDFNTDDPDTPQGQSPGERTFAMMRKAGFLWSFDGVEHSQRITCPGKGRYPDASFDHVFTKGLGTPIASVVHAGGSDHFPVVLDVVLTNRK